MNSPAASYESLGFRTISAPFDDYGAPHVERAATALLSNKLRQSPGVE